MDKVALDASAALAMLQQEAGGAAVTALVVEGAAEVLISTVNFCEVVTKLVRDGLNPKEAFEAVSVLHQFVVPFDEEQALRAAGMYPSTRGLGLSLGDRACWHWRRHAERWPGPPTRTGRRSRPTYR